MARVLAGLALAAALAALASASSSPGQTTPPRIAYEKKVGRKNAQIWVMNADGSNWKKLRQGCCFEWSPDGSRIAFHGWRPGYGARSGLFDLYVMRADGTGLLRVARNPHGTGLAWSPDGMQIVFSGGGGRGSSALYLVNADGTGLTRLTTHRPDDRDVNPAWSPDGKRIAFAREAASEILIVNADGTDLQVIEADVDRASYPTWSPDGSRIAFQGETDEQGYGINSDIFVVNSDGSALRALTQTPRTRDELPRWSPDGRKLLFSSLPRGSDSDVHSINADGTKHVDLTRSPKFDGYPDWAPDGKSVIFVSGRDGSIDIYSMTATGRQPLNLTNGSAGTRNHYPALSGRP